MIENELYWKNISFVSQDKPRELSWALAANVAASLVTIFLSKLISSLKSRRQVTRSMDGLDRTVLSESMSMGAAAGMMGYTVKYHPQPLTEPSLTNFHLSSSPSILSSWDQSDHSRPIQQIY